MKPLTLEELHLAADCVLDVLQLRPGLNRIRMARLAMLLERLTQLQAAMARAAVADAYAAPPLMLGPMDGLVVEGEWEDAP